MKTLKRILISLVVLVLMVLCVLIGRQFPVNVEEETPLVVSDSAEEAEGVDPKWWTCAMHPSVKLPSGDMKCPICFMDLTPVYDDGGGEGDIPVLTLSERARYLAEVETSPVERKAVSKTVRLVGKIQPDETHLSVITAWVAGRLDRLFVDYTGMEVRKGDHLVELYSPELYASQQELLQSISSFEEIRGSQSEMVARRSESMIESSKNKLRRLGLTDEQVEEVIESGKPQDRLTIYSPTSGIVTERQGTVGMYVTEGSRIYTIADLSTVWLLLEAYESDVKWLHYGQSVEFQTEAHPGETFEGTLSFISPVLDERTRTITLRVNVPNEGKRLKPGMFARAEIRSLVAAGGKTIAPGMAGKWICPMHPEVVEDLYGFCPVCEMPLETASSLGYVTAAGKGDLALVVPETAPLLTGKRAVVYVELEDDERIRYEGRTVELGPNADGYYVVESGLAEGERVVTKGNFKIDSAMQIQAKPSMMNPAEEPESGWEIETQEEAEEEQATEPVPLPKEFAEKARPVLTTYLALQEALAGDSFENADKAASDLTGTIGELGKHHLPGEAHDRRMEDLGALKKSVDPVNAATEIETLRASFYPLSQSVETFVRDFGNETETPLKKVFCPMALEDGAYWLQTGKDVANPYFGDTMLRCGTFQTEFPPRMAASEKAP
jgi:Cu(I)/Ag(I) efflux system membrane fusion protein